MNTLVQTLNTTGRTFVDLAIPMLIQSSVLILILLAVDAVLRTRVRAIFRYWIWMLVLVKLVLPPSLWSPVSVGTWFGDTLEVPATALLEVPQPTFPEEQGQNALATRLSPAVTSLLSRPPQMLVEPPSVEPTIAPPSPAPLEAARELTPTVVPPVSSLNWQGFVLLAWLAVVTALFLLLIQRTFFVQGLVAQGDEAGGAMLRELDQCRRGLGLRQPISLRLSPNATSPAVCGLWSPVILIPQNLASRLHGADLQAVLYHELAHIKRGDLWVNLLQTLLQIVYFYNPLLWLANAAIRRLREKAVDETVLVALGEAAPQYPQTLVNMAKLAFTRRPALSLRLIGVVESKSALTGRIKHILNRPIPKTAKLGLAGLSVLLLMGALLLPMAKAEEEHTYLRGINESLDITDRSGHLRIRSLQMTPPDGKQLVGTNEATLSVRVENTGSQEAYLGLEYYANAGTVAGGLLSPGASSATRVLCVPAQWQGDLTYPIHYSRFARNGYIRLRLAKCQDRQTQMFLSPEAEVLYDRKHVVCADEPQAATDNARDSDGDGLSDYDEIHKYRTDPAQKDSDGDGIPDGDWNERREYTYSVRTVLRYQPPADEKALTDDFQDGRILKRTNEYIEAEIIHYPLATGYDDIPENRNWRQDDAHLREYLAPGASTNWDEPMKRDLLAALKADGIDLETLSDKQVVEQVSRWLLRRSRYLDKVFTTWYVYFPQGKPAVYPGLEDAFRHEFERDSRNYDWTLDRHFDHEVLGKGMFYNKTHGSCTSTAVYLTTVLRALGIPTRMVLVAPAVDPSDHAQVLMVKNAITHNRVRMTMLAGLGRSSHGFVNHTFNEVYVGGRWRRLDYDRLGCPAFGLDRLGLQTHLYTLKDLSDADLASTWGTRYATGARDDVFRHDNPYTAVEISEQFGPHGQVANPPCTAQDIDPHTKPDLFVFSPPRVAAWEDVWAVMGSATFNKTGRFHDRESYENLCEGIWLVHPQDILVLLFSLDTPGRVPEGYEDLLPQPWPEIEAQLKLRQTVECSGKAREMNVVVLAAPTAEGLKPLIQNSKLLRALGGSGPAPRPVSGPPQTPLQPGGLFVEFSSGLKIQLLGVCEHPSEGKSWWRPDGSPLEKAPYRTTGDRLSRGEGMRDFDYAARVWGGQNPEVEWSVAGGGHSSDTGRAVGEDGRPLPDVFAFMNNQPPEAETANVLIGVAEGVWNTPVVHRNPGAEGFYIVDDDRSLEIGFGPAEARQGDTYVPVTTNFGRSELNFEVVAVDSSGALHEGSVSGRGGIKLNNLTYHFSLPLSDVKEFRLQTRPLKWVAFRNVSLRPGRKTQVQVEFIAGPNAFRADAPGPAPSAPVPATVSREPSAREAKIVGIGPAWEALRDAVGGRYQGTIGGFSSDNERCAGYFEHVLSRARPGDAFVLMLAFDQPVGVPPQYRDLLPLPWAQIESRVKDGQTVEVQGQARNLTVLVLAAPTTDQLNTLVWRTPLLDPFRPEAAQGPTAVPSSQSSARLPEGAPPPGTNQEKEIVLPDVDRMPGMLDLAAAKFLPVPGGSPEEIGRAIEKLGQGDLVYDSLHLILVRGAGSPQAHAGPASFPTYDIKPPLPVDLTVTTAEGRQYQITILAANDQSCAFKYSLVSADRGAGGGAPGRSGETTSDTLGKRTPFSVYGTVTDTTGRGLPGVDVRASCGLTTLMPAGQTVTDEAGRYTLYFDSGFAGREGTDPENVVLQAALILVHKAGFYEVNLCRQGNLGMAGKAPEPGDPHAARFAGVALPNKPLQVNFVLRPAARIVGELVDARDRPLSGQALQVKSDNLYPGAGVLASLETGRDGTFLVEHVPLESFWFETGGPTPTKTEGIPFTAAGTWRIKLRYDQSAREKLTIVNLQPQPVAVADSAAPAPAQKTLKQLLNEARPGAVVTIPRGRYTAPVEITKPVVLRGESPEGCVLEVTADQPAILMNTNGQGPVTIENLTIRWQLASDKKVELPAAVRVKDTNAVIRNCRIVPLGDTKRSPMAIYVDGKSQSTVDNCQFNGFDYVVCYGPGTEGIVQDCIITDCGHQGVINYTGATLTVQRNIITGSKFHAVRCTGGTLHVKDNLLIKNANRGIYLGNRSGRGTITNNLILGNGSGISAFAQADYVIANNVIRDNRFAGIDMRNPCRLSIRSNVLARNQRGLVLFQEGTGNSNVVGPNVFWANATDVQNLEKPADSIAADPQFADPNHGDFAMRSAARAQGYGLTNPQVLKDLWQRYEQLQSGGAEPKASSAVTTNAAPQGLSGRVVDPNGRPLAGAQVALCTEEQGVTIAPPRLAPTDFPRKASAIGETDSEGRFSFSAVSGEFVIFAAHEAGFARATREGFSSPAALRLQRWGQVEGTLCVGRKPGVDQTVKISADWGGGAVPWPWVRYEQETKTGDAGRYRFSCAAPGWVRLAHDAWMPDGRRESNQSPIGQGGPTNERWICVPPGQTLQVAIGGTGRPVIGKLVLPPSYHRRAGQTWAMRMLNTARSETSPPAANDAVQRDTRQRFYSFPIDAQDSFRVEDVIPGRYELRVWLWDVPSQPPVPSKPVGPFVADVEVPPLPETYMDEPLDLGDLALEMDETGHAGLAWQRTDRYVPPDPDGFFPDNPEAGKRLDKLFQAVDKDDRPADEILSTVRRGLRRTTQSRSSILAWIGNRYIWTNSHQHPDAIEIMYHAVPIERHYAIYFGLSVVRDKTPNILRTLADLCLQNDEEVGRITWGLGAQREALLPYLNPYLQDPDPAKRRRVDLLVKHFKGELDFERRQREQRQEEARARFAGQLPQFEQALLTGDSNARYRALIDLLRGGGTTVLDDSALPAMVAAGADPDRRVRNEVARLAGNRWVWAAENQDPNAIALMLRLAGDSDREVRYNAVYYGLSVVREKDEPVVRRLAELALADHENSLYGRIVWGLRGFSKDTVGLVGKVLAEYLARTKSDVHYAASVYGLYRDVLEKEPPADWGLGRVRQQYPDDLFILPVSAREPFQPENLEALWSELTHALPQGIAAERLPTWDTNAKHIVYARIRGKEQAETARGTISSHPRLRVGEIRPLPLTMQLYLEEMSRK